MGKLESDCAFPKKVSEKTSEDLTCTPSFDPGHRDRLRRSRIQRQQQKAISPGRGGRNLVSRVTALLDSDVEGAAVESREAHGVGKSGPLREGA